MMNSKPRVKAISWGVSLRLATFLTTYVWCVCMCANEHACRKYARVGIFSFLICWFLWRDNTKNECQKSNDFLRGGMFPTCTHESHFSSSPRTWHRWEVTGQGYYKGNFFFLELYLLFLIPYYWGQSCWISSHLSDSPDTQSWGKPPTSGFFPFSGEINYLPIIE